MLIPRKKKDFKIREDIVREFERYAPSGKQTAIIESLLADWVSEQRRKELHQEMREAYAKANRRP